MTEEKTTTVLEDARAEVADFIGVDAQQIIIPDVDWLKMMNSGVIVSVHLSYWRMKTKLSYEDLGLQDVSAEEATALAEIMSIGEKFLAPVKYIKAVNSIDTGLRTALKKFGFKTYYGQFVPATSFYEWQETFDSFNARLLALRDELCADWSATTADTLDKYAVAARIAYRRLTNLASRRGQYSFEAEDSFVESFMQRIQSAIPTQQAVFDSFKARFDMQYIPLPSLLQEDQLRADQLKEEAALKSEEDNAAYRLRMEVMTRARDTQYEMIEDFKTNVVSQLQDTAYNAAVDVLETLKRNDGSLIGPSVKQLRNMIETLESLNFYGDSDMTVMVQQLKSQLAGAGDSGQRDTQSMQQALRDIATVTRSKLVTLGQSARSAREVGIVEMPDGFTVRQSRKNLGLTIDAEDMQPAARAKRTL